MYYREWVT